MTLARKISIVHVESGLVENRAADTLTSDLPPDGAHQAPAASIDAAGHLLYRSREGRVHMCMATTRALGDRKPRDVFLVTARAAATDAAGGWARLEVSVLEPGIASGLVE